jgi:phosphate:Na+ symporter
MIAEAAGWIGAKLRRSKAAAPPALRVLTRDALHDPARAMTLIARELDLAFADLPHYLDQVRKETRDRSDTTPARDWYRQTAGILGQVEAFTADLRARGASSHAAEIETLQRRTETLRLLADALRELADTVARATDSPALATLTSNLLEGLHLALITVADSLEHPDQAAAELVDHLTADRGELMARIRGSLLRAEVKLSAGDHHVLFTSTNLFERAMRLLRRLG